MLGGMADLPLRLGGGPTASEAVYQVIRKAAGKGGSAEDDTQIEGLWRMSEAKGLATATSDVPRALLQSNPLFATDTIPYYERILGIIPPEGASDTERRAVIIPLWTRRIDVAIPNVLSELQGIDPRFSIVTPDDAQSITTQPGRPFGSSGSRMILAGDISTVANYSSDFFVRVLFDLGYPGRPNPADLRLLNLARRKVRELVQGWETFTFSTGPWVLGVTPIGLGSLG